MTRSSPESVTATTDEEALAATMNILEQLASTALAGFKDDINPSDALSKINNLARSTIGALSQRRLASQPATTTGGEVAWCGWHPDHGLNFGTIADTQHGATSRLMRTGIAGNHGWSAVPLYATPIAMAQSSEAPRLSAGTESAAATPSLPLDKWIEREFAGYGVAIRCKEDDPVPGEPFMSMAEAKELTRRAVAEFGLRAAAQATSEPSDEWCDAFLKATGEWIEAHEPEMECGVPMECEITQEFADELNADARKQIRKGYAAACSISSTDRPFDPAEWEKIVEDRQEAVAQASPQDQTP